jgi:hypothetical protein
VILKKAKREIVTKRTIPVLKVNLLIRLCFSARKNIISTHPVKDTKKAECSRNEFGASELLLAARLSYTRPEAFRCLTSQKDRPYQGLILFNYYLPI